MSTQIDDRIDVYVGDREAPVRCTRVLSQQRHGAKVHYLACGRPLWWYGEGTKSIELLAGDLEWLLRSCKPSHSRCRCDSRIDDFRDVLEQVFAVVQDDQRSTALQARDQLRSSLIGPELAEAQDAGDRANDLQRVTVRSKIDPPHTVIETTQFLPRYNLRETCLADAADSHECDEGMIVDQLADYGDVRGTTEQRWKLLGKVGSKPSRIPERREFSR